MNRFLEELVRAHPKATYGEMMIKKALDMGAVDTLLISEGMRKNSVNLKCESCGNEWNVSLTRVPRIAFLLKV